MKYKIPYTRKISKGIKFDTPSKTIQSAKDECDINIILKKYKTTGQLPDLIKSNPQYGDFSQVSDYQSAMNVIVHAQEQFSALSAHVRKRFNNDPAEFLSFAQDASNSSEMIKLGLASKKQSDAPKSAPINSQASSGTEAAVPAVGEGPK